MTGTPTPCVVCDRLYPTNARRVGPPLCSADCADTHLARRMDAGEYLQLLCLYCKEVKPETEYWRDNGRTCRRQNRCKVCSEAQHVQWEKDNPERARSTARRATNKHKLAKLGLTPEQKDAMLADQRGVCAICKRPEVLGRALAVDHCHATGRVRGLLCQRCNVSIGQFEDRVDLLESAIAYLQAATQRTLESAYE